MKAKIHLLSKHLVSTSILSIFAVVLGLLAGCEERAVSPVLSEFEEEQGLVLPQINSLNPKTPLEVLPGWSMYFFDFEPEKELELIVIQSAPGEEGELAEATGFGRYVIGEKRGPLIVTRASWSNWADRAEGYPENAPQVEGIARIEMTKWVPFTAQLISHGWPDTQDYDEAVLIIAETGFDEERFEGELHHGRLRAYLKEVPEGEHNQTP
jgi:hypothetical protein